MNTDEPKPLAEKRNRVAFGVLLSAAALLLASFLDPEWKDFFSYVFRLIQDPERWFDSVGAIAVVTIFTVNAVTLASPPLFAWLCASRPLRIIQRFLSLTPALILLYFMITLDGVNEPMLILLTTSPFITFIGLCLIKPFAPQAASL